ncbi:uncharacterized protein LOC131052623 [Cryptomeria japonica]|uniref:uncharacterized protein LOC131052623 n=1 Tax=Cryptomeria japonica TaxID=3369 RepID=UPI0027D9FCFE|nr:uncharacterized protein LOC131052623 [Cryptomeria japonica]XP_059068022.1 uncharacterized protein LOC131052623 [Cryptomeria japonica]
MAGSPAERFIGWALPQLGEGSADPAAVELALAGLHEFFSAGDANGIERYASPVIRACKELLEDERTSLSLVRSLLNLLTVLSVKFTRHFQSHFADIVDLLLGWALVPDLSETDRCLITDKFLQFQKLWAGNLQFSANLLSKFLGDMEVLAHDATPGTPQQLRRLLALVSCFVIVLQATATGMLEMNLLEHIIEPLQEMVPRLLTCLLMVAQNFGDARWLKESSRCLILLADILKERFVKFYPAAMDVLLQCLGTKSAVVSGANVFSSSKVQAVVKTNLQLMSSQRLALESSSVHMVLKVDSFFAYLRLHPNHLVTGLVSATYIFLLKHGSNDVVSQAILSITSELELLTGLLLNAHSPGNDNQDILGVQQEPNERSYDQVAVYSFGRFLSEFEISALIRFDLMVLINSLMDTGKGPVDSMSAVNYRLKKAEEICYFILEKLNPFRNPFPCHADLQFALIQALHRLSNFTVCGKNTIIEAFAKKLEVSSEYKGGSQISAQRRKEISMAVSNNINVYGSCIAKALNISSGLSVKLEALDWINSFCESLMTINSDDDSFQCFCNQGNADFQTCCHTGLSRNILFAVLSAASDRELKVRFRVASVLEKLLQAKLIYPVYLAAVADVALEKLGDPDSSLQIAFRKVLSLVVISAMYLGGCIEIDEDTAYQKSMACVKMGTKKYWHWKKVFAIKHFSQSSRPQQLVSVLNYISQRWQVFPSGWLQRLVLSYCGNLKSRLPKSNKDSANSEVGGLWIDRNVDGEMLERVCSTNNLAAAWWSIHEAARHCITICLRTHLGRPTQTFAALERMLLDVAQLLQVDPGRREASSGIGSPSVHLLPMRLLLEFVESLKKQIYNAYDGSAVLPAAPSQSVIFFRGNKKVCEEWFARICEALMNASLAIQCNSGIIHYAAIRLQDLRNAAATTLIKDIARSQTVDNSQGLRTKMLNDVLRVLRHASLAFCRVNESDAIVGLQTWAASTFGALTTDDGTPGQKSMDTSGLFGWMTGLVHQAKGQYEKAAAHFTHLLQSEDALGSMGADAVQFVIARIIENYVALADWKSLDHWLQELQLLRAKHAGKSYSGALTTAGNEMNAIHALASFDEGDVQDAWGYLGLTPQSSSELTVDPRQAIRRSEQMLLQAMLHRDSKEDVIKMEIERAKAMLEEALLVSSIDGMREAVAYATQFHCIYAFEAGCKLVACRDEFGDFSSVSSSLQQVVKVPMNVMQQDCLLWLKLLRVYRTVLPESKLTLHLCRQLIRLARKQTNFKMAHRLHRQLLDGVSKCNDSKFSEWILSSLQYERILLLFAEGNSEESISELWSLVRSYIPVSPASVVSAFDNSMKAKACLKLSSWLKQTYSEIHWPNFLTKMNLDNLWFKSCEFTSNVEEGSSSREANLMSVTSYTLIVEEVVGASIKTSTLLCPNMSKAWLSYALWCYDHAKASLSGDHPVLKSCHLSQILVQELSSADSSLLEEEVMSVRAIIMRFFLKNEITMSLSEEMRHWPDTEVHRKSSVINFVELLVQRIVYIMQSAAGAAGVENADGESASSLLFSQLHREMLKINQEIDSSVFMPLINDLMDIWWVLRRRRVSLFGHAARGFLQFLSLSNRMHIEKHNRKSCNLELSKHVREDYILKATLYGLHILVNFGVELEDAIEQGLMTVSPVPWQEIIPQLFARLSTHPEKKVRKQLENLLMTLAKLSPWAIVYPTLVDINACEGEPSEELQRILDCLGKVHPKLVQDVQLMIVELGSITVLWEEQWLSTLQDLHADVMRRIATLKEEVSRVAENMTLTHSEKVKINAAKYSAMMAPIAVALERRLTSTSRMPETAHEAWFQNEYGEQIKDAITSFKTPHSTAASLADVWRPFDIIAASLANHQKKPSVSLGDIAPKLAHLSSSDAPMPGLEKQILMSDSEAEGSDHLCPVTVSSFSEQVTILATKTKPKKLVFLGSDGQRYTYLLKGREDLRLDARIMQLLHAINGMLNGSLNMRSRLLAVRYYSVTPISGRAGLIQWVDNVVSMYSVFKAWQQRVQYSQFASTVGGTAAANIPPVPRPSDMFYGKIIPALKEKGLRKVISRRDWPQEVKRKVLLDLMKETPRQLLYKEIWCSSEGLQNFSLKLGRFSGTVAAMSMVGHILGLGDRHLDNILMDFSTGDVVHIDYNVCFDKGLRLKIPEIVPFRLTQTMQAALGLTGIEGTFRANCEMVIDILRKNKDIILMLLEVFVWDPLIEWMRGDGHDEATIGGEERKGMELAVSLSLFASRFQEIRVPLQEHHDLLLGTLPASSSALQNLADVLDRYETISTLFGHAEQERSKCVMAEASAKSILIEAAGNLEKVRLAYELQAHEFAQAKALLTETAQKASTWIEQHSRVLDALRNGSAPELQVIGKTSSAAEALSLTSAVLAAGVPLTIVPEPTQVHCQEVDKEVECLTKELHKAVVQAAKALQSYSVALQCLLRGNYIASSQMHSWAQVLQLCVRQLSPEVLALSRRQASDLVGKGQGEHADIIRQNYETLCIKIDMVDKEIRKIQEDCSELEASIESENEYKAKDRLLAIFTKHLQPNVHFGKDDDTFTRVSGYNRQDEMKERDMGFANLDEKRVKVLTVLHVAAASLYCEIKGKIFNICNSLTDRITLGPGEDIGSQNWKWCLPDLEEQIGRCALVINIVNEVQQLSGQNFIQRGSLLWDTTGSGDDNWNLSIQGCLTASHSLVSQMTGLALPEAMKSVLSQNPAIMEAFGSLSQIRGAVDTALEQLAEIEIQRSSLIELEKTYHENVEEITKKKASLEMAIEEGRDHLSWEEAEELASQVETYRAQLDKLRNAWEQRDIQTSALARRELSAQGALVAAEQRFESLVTFECDGDMHPTRGYLLLATFARPFSELESFDQKLAAFGHESSKKSSSNQIEIVSSGFSGFQSVWKATNMLKDHTFFVWKVGIIDASLDSCIRNVASAIDHNTLGFDQIVSIQKRKLEIQIEYYLDQYLRERLAPIFLECLEKEEDSLKHILQENRELESNIAKKEFEAVKRAQGLLVEYSNAHETARAAKAAASAMKLQVRELSQDLQKAKLEAAQLEWLHDYILPLPEKGSILTQGCANEDKLPPSFIMLNRRNLLDNIRSAMSAINRATEDLRSCERSAISTEEQLERAMGWACAGPSTGGGSNNSSRGMGIPPEFHEHLRRRKHLLLAGKEQASGILKLCAAVSDFEDSRDGFLRPLSDVTPGGSLSDGKAWQQGFLNIVSRLDHSYHSFTRADHEWHLAQKSMEAATASLSTATNDLRLVSMKSKSTSGELQATLSSMRDWVVKASEELSAFCRVARSNSALTTETGSMLEEVLAITEGAEGAHDVYRLAKDVSVQHSNLMSELNKVTFLLLPLESTLASASSAIIGIINREGGQKLEVFPGQGQAIFQSLHSNLGEVRPILTTAVPVLLNTVKELHIALTRLARTASFDAGVLHKALEGVGESQEARSQELDLVGPELDGDEVLNINQDRNLAEAVRDNDEHRRESVTDEEILLQADEESWISPPDSLETSGSESDGNSSQSTIYQNQEEPVGIFNDWESHVSGADMIRFSGGELEDASRYTVNEDILFTSPSFIANSQEDPAMVPIIGTDGKFEVPYMGNNQVCTGSNQIHFSKGTNQKPEGSQASVSLTKASSEILSSTHINVSEIGISYLNATEKHQTGELQQGMKQKQLHLTTDKGGVGSYNDLSTLFSSMKTEQRSHTFRGKNAYAVSVLKRVEARLEGRDIDGKRQFTVSEQVDHLIRQATSIDNLCNMYEGWTPWI